MKFTDEEMKLIEKNGFIGHCKVAALIMGNMEINPHTKHHIRGAVREASNKLTTSKGSGKDKAHYMSKNIQKQLNAGKLDGLVLEHGVPVSFMNDRVLKLKNKTHEEIAKIIRKWTVLSVITKKEHDKLKDKGLYKKMPDDWDGINKFARYEKVKIELVKNRYKELKKLL